MWSNIRWFGKLHHSLFGNLIFFFCAIFGAFLCFKMAIYIQVEGAAKCVHSVRRDLDQVDVKARKVLQNRHQALFGCIINGNGFASVQLDRNSVDVSAVVFQRFPIGRCHKRWLVVIASDFNAVRLDRQLNQDRSQLHHRVELPIELIPRLRALDCWRLFDCVPQRFHIDQIHLMRAKQKRL